MWCIRKPAIHMFLHNLKLTWRSLLKDRQSTILNLVGLSTGLACVLFIYLWVADELGVNKVFTNDDRLYTLMEKRTRPGVEGASEESSGLLAATVAKEVPEVEYAATVLPGDWFPKSTLSVGDK